MLESDWRVVSFSYLLYGKELCEDSSKIISICVNYKCLIFAFYFKLGFKCLVVW